MSIKDFDTKAFRALSVKPWRNMGLPCQLQNAGTAVDCCNPAPVPRYIVYPIIYRALYIPGGCLGFLPSTERHLEFTET